ncbi:hypothetical protein R83H12_01660 [Fibrobacteria bacterium R8-3-H12]
MKINLSFLSTAALALAITLTLSCSPGDGGNDDNGGSSSPSGGGVSSSVPSSSSAVGISSSSGSSSSSSSVTPQSGVVYGPSVTYGGETYETVVIGSQFIVTQETWMAKNLNYNVEGSRCYDNDPANCAIYGRLYDWATAMALPDSCNRSTCDLQIDVKHRGICPAGWHIPDGEWTTLVNLAGGSSTAGKKLKATSGWDDNGNGTDDYGFAALPGGRGNSDGSFDKVGNNGYWWSSSEFRANAAYYWNVYSGYRNVHWNYYIKNNLFSVRCVQD